MSFFLQNFGRKKSKLIYPKTKYMWGQKSKSLHNETAFEKQQKLLSLERAQFAPCVVLGTGATEGEPTLSAAVRIRVPVRQLADVDCHVVTP